ncbi:MAG: PAS domain-containing protein [Pirellulales bacterium]|nr:PAS domain-containing protein [Pirellulales bacterium]
MVTNRPKTGLSRKIVAYYLCFCLAAVCWVAAALLVTSHALLRNRTTNSCLSRLGKASAAIESHWLRSGEEGLDAVVISLSNECRAAYWTIVGVDGTHLAHTQPALQGKVAVEHAGTRANMGDAIGVRYESPSGAIVQEYRIALATKKGAIGDLRVGIEEPTFTATILAAAPYIPIALLAPLALVGVGAVLLSRFTRPVTAVESRLREIARQPLGESVEVAPLRATDAISLGWNRVVEQLQRAKRTSERGDIGDALAQAAQARTDTQYEQILQRLSDGIAVTDADGRIAFANRAISALLGQEGEQEALTGPALEARLLEVVECPEGSDLLSAAGQRRTTVCEMVQRGAECERVLRVARLPLGDAAHGHVWNLRDITQQKLAEQTRDRFIDTATHELRTPLSNIKAYAETLATADCIDVELQKEFCNIINSEVTRLARFIDDLLSISSMEVGALTVERAKVETERLFAEVLSKIEPLMQQKEITFEADLPPKMPELHLDKDKMLSVIVNILGNAAKYTPTGGRVTMKVRVEDERLKIAVQDTGVGISAEDLPRLWDKFFRSDDPRVQAETGTGLGLSLTREIVRMHGGEVTVESELNKGSTFTVSLPLT